MLRLSQNDLIDSNSIILETKLDIKSNEDTELSGKTEKTEVVLATKIIE